MARRIALIQGHPDPRGNHYCHALARSYASGAAQAGHEVKTIAVARLDIPVLRTREDWESAIVPEAILEAQKTIEWAQHLVFFYPLWLGSMPALLKAFLEQVLRPGFGIGRIGEGEMQWKKLLAGRSARIVVTMGMPASIYRWYFGAHSLKSLERNILGFCGIGPIRESLVGSVEGSAGHRARWLEKLRTLGRDAT